MESSTRARTGQPGIWIITAILVALAGVFCPSADAAMQAPTGSGVGEALRQAAEARKFLFVFVFDPGDSGTAAVRAPFEAAVAKVAAQALWIAVDRTDAAERAFVDLHGLKTSPMPLVMAFAPNGAITSAITGSPPTEERLREALVSRATLLLGLVGGVAGFVLGTVLAVALGPRMAVVPVLPMPSLALSAVGIGAGVALLASVFPAWRAARLDPCAALQEI